MPFARLTLTPALPAADTQRLARTLTDLVATVLRKKHDLTAVLVESPAAPTWTVAGAAGSAHAHLEVCVTAGTNTPEEKRAFVAEADAALRAAIPGLSEVTYVVVRETQADAWGWGGRTQADRAAAR